MHLLLGGTAILIGYNISRKILVPPKNTDPSLRTTPASSSAAAREDELLRVYDLPSSSFPEEPPHLTPIDPSVLVPRETRYPIDLVHRRGYLHEGHSLFVMDSNGEVLFLQRSSDVVTCPSTWSILGEHSNADETNPRETVARGLEEELGFVALNFDDASPDFSHAWTAELHPRDNMRDSLRVTIQNATEFPLYYIRHYGPRNDGRIDRQLTYLWMVQFPRGHGEIPWRLDDEVADHRWVKLDDVASWLSEDATKHKNKFEGGDKTGSGARDDGPDEGDFCHGTIRVLYEAGLMNML